MESKWKVNGSGDSNKQVLTSVSVDSGEGFTSIQVEDCGSPGRDSRNPRTPRSELNEHCSADDKRSHLPTSVGYLSSLIGADVEGLSGSSMTRESTTGKVLTGQVKGVASNSIENAPDSVGRSFLKSGNHLSVKMNDSNVSFDFRLGNSQDHLEIHLETGDDDGLSGTNTSRGRSSSEVISLLSSPERESVEHAEERRKSLISAATAADIPRFKWGDLDDEELEHMEQMEHMEEVLLSGPNGLSETPVLSSLTPDNGTDSLPNLESEKQAGDVGQVSTELALLAHSGSIGLAQDAASGNTLGAHDLSCAKGTQVVPKPDTAGIELGGKSDLSNGPFDDHVLGATDAYSLACYYSKRIDHDMGARDKPPRKSSYYRSSPAEAVASAKSVVEVAALRDTIATGTRNEVVIKKDSIRKHKSLAKGSHNFDAMALVAVLSKATCESPKAAIDFERESMSNGGEVGEDWSVDPSKSSQNRMIARSDDKDGKDWFRQRLWCYLFENLKRAIDELYFLCDLQADVDQMKEALLVLNEAGIDFKELKSRLDGVAKVNKAPALPSPQSSASSRSSLSGVAEKQQRRPHAIAWEVRRLTTSESQADSKGREGEAFKQAQRADQASESQERQVSDPVRESDKQTAAHQSSHVQVTRSECGSPIDKEMWKTGGASVESDNSPKKRKLSKKAARDQMTGRLMRPTESSNIRVAFTTREKEKEREKEREKDVRDQCWSIGTKNAVEAWKEKKNWVDILATPRGPSQSNRSQASDSKQAKHVQVLNDEPRSQEVKKILGSDLVEVEKQVRSAKPRMHLDVERVHQMQSDSEKQHNEDEWQSVRSNRLREGLYGHQQRGDSRQGSYCDHRPNIGSGRVSVTSSQHEEDKKVSYQQHHKTEIQRTEKMKAEQRQDLAREEAAVERLRVLEAQKKKRVADAQSRKQELKGRREEDLKYSVTSRKDRIIEQVHKRVARASSQPQESEVLEQKLAERLRESAQRREDQLDLIKECVTTEPENRRGRTRSGSPGSLLEGSPLSRQFKTRERTNFVQISEAGMTTLMDSSESSTLHKQAMKKRLKKIRQKLASKKQDFHEPPLGEEALGMGTATVAGLARFKIGRWMEELRRLQQAKDYGKSLSISGLITEIVICLQLTEPELHAARQQGLLEYAAVSLPIPYRTSEVTLGLLRIQRVLLCLPANRSYFIARNLLPPMIPMLSSSLQIFSTYGGLFPKVDKEAAGNTPRRKGSESSQEKLREEELDTLQEVLEGLLISATSIMGHTCSDEYQLGVQDDLADLIVVCEVIHRLRNLFAVFQPRGEQAPIPDPIVSGLKLLETMTGSKRKSLLAAHEEPINIVVHAASVSQAELSSKDQDRDQPSYRRDSLKEGGIPMLAALGTDNREERNKLEREQSVEMEKRTKSLEAVPHIVITQKESTLARSTTILVAAIAETELVGLPSLLSAVVLQAEPRHSAEQVACGLPSNFDEVTTIVLRILNNVARLDLSLAQNKLALPDVGLEFYHLVSFLLTHCTCKWKTSNDEIAALLLETLLLLGYAALLHPGNQAILRWGKSPTILHKMCDLPFAFFSDPKLTPILIGTLLAVCYGSEVNRDVVQQELSMDMLLAFLKSLKMGLIQPPASQSNNVKLDTKEAPKKAKSKVTHGIPNPDLDTTTSQICPRQKVPLPKAFVTSSRGRVTPISARGGFYSAGPSTPREARGGSATFRSTSRCSMSSPTPHLPPLPTRKTKREPSSRPFPKMSCRSVDTRDGEEIVSIESLPTAFALRNRFPEGLWTFAEEFFSSGSWMGHIVKCL